jgi:hypothetical protein
MPNAELDTTRGCDDPPGDSVVPQLETFVAVGVLFDAHCVADRVVVTCSVISTMRELFSEDEAMEF